MRPNKKSKWLIGGEGGQCFRLVEKAALRKHSMMLNDADWSRKRHLIDSVQTYEKCFIFVFVLRAN